MNREEKQKNGKDFNVDDFIPTEKSVNEGYDTSEFYREFNVMDEQYDRNLVIAFLGTADSGKTSGIKALFGVDFGEISPIPGSTTKVKVRQIDKNVFIADAPGFGDIKKEVSQKAKAILDSTDIFIYILNAEGGYKMQEKEDYQNLLTYNRETLVVLNKIDLLRDGQRDAFIEDQRTKMGVQQSDFIPVAFDPLPKLAEEPINVDSVQKWIQKTLEEKGKDLLFAKVARKKDKLCSGYINKACVAAASAGALPIPGSDYVTLTGIQAVMVGKIARVYNHTINAADAKALIVQTFAGRAGRELFRGIITAAKTAGWIPGAGWILQIFTSAVAASIASSVTYGLGKAAQAYYKSNMQIPIIELQNVFQKESHEAPKTEKGG